MTAPNSTDGWIEWSGGKCPVELGSMFRVTYRDGLVSAANIYANDNWCSPGPWEHRGNSLDIIAYRVVTL